MHKFRSADSVNQWVALWWQVASGMFTPYDTDNAVSNAAPDTIDSLCSIIRHQSHDMICINDPEGNADMKALAFQLRAAFESILPEKSSFEK
jgi:hypothetical protein